MLVVKDCVKTPKVRKHKDFLTFLRSGKLASATFRQLFLHQSVQNETKSRKSNGFTQFHSDTFFAGKDASRPPVFVRLIQPSWRGSETTGLPAAGAAFRPQGDERVNRSMRRKRQRIAASMEVAKGGTALGFIQRAIPPQIVCFIFHSFFYARPEGGKSCAAFLPINLSPLQRFGR